MSAPPTALTMERLRETDDLVITQATGQCCRCLCLQPTINFVIADGAGFTTTASDDSAANNPFQLEPKVGWIHEESSFCGRTWSCCFDGFRAVKYVQHSGPAPAYVVAGDTGGGGALCQTSPTQKSLTEEDRHANLVAIHEKTCTAPSCVNFCGQFAFPVCNCFTLPYLETKDPETGKTLGKTQYVCDQYCFVPKYDVYNGSGDKVFFIRPKTCVAGCCVKCNCGSGYKNSKCFRVPYFIRRPDKNNHDILEASGTKEGDSSEAAKQAMIDILFAGWKDECCTQKNAYHLVFPKDITPQEKLVLMGSNIMVDFTMNEQSDE